MKTRPARILVVCSPGGHLVTARAIVDRLQQSYGLEIHGVIAGRGRWEEVDSLRSISDANRDWRVVLQFFSAIMSIVRVRPKIIVSTGAGVAVPFFLLARLFRIRTLYLESFSRVSRLSLAARLCGTLSDVMIVRYRRLMVPEKSGTELVE